MLEQFKHYEGGANYDGDITSTLRVVSRPVLNPVFFSRFVLRLSYVAATDLVLVRILSLPRSSMTFLTLP